MQLTHGTNPPPPTLQKRPGLLDDRRRLAALDGVLKEQKEHKEQRESKEDASPGPRSQRP